MSLPACCCEDRERASESDGFQFIASLDGWCFTDGPRRRMTLTAQSFAVTRGIENHTGEPFVWTCCPFCGGELPRPTLGWEDE